MGCRNRWDGDQFCFVFPIEGQKTVYLPEFELARALFFHDGYLARTSLTSNALNLEFDIQTDEDSNSALVNVLPSSGYTLRHLNDPRSRETLAWILLDHDARTAFESIGNAQLLQGRNRGTNRVWDFRFSPPPLPGASFGVRGQFDKQTGTLFVYKIDKIQNVQANVPTNIIFEHPDFKHPVRPDGPGESPIPIRPQGSLEIDDDTSPNVNTLTTIINSANMSIDFSNPFTTTKRTSKTKITPYGKPGEGRPVNGNFIVSTDEAVAGEELASADWNNLNDDSHNGHLFDNKFSVFMRLIQTLTQRHGCRLLGKNVYPLPPIARCTKHLLANGDPRCIAVAYISAHNYFVRLLEVDTSDAATSLSTQLVRASHPTRWPRDLEQITSQLVKRSLSWPTDLLKSLYGRDGHQGIPHPQTPSNNKGILTAESISSWAERVAGWIKRVY